MAAEDRTARGRPLVRGSMLALAMLAAVTLGATACAQEADPADVAVADVDYEATPEFVAAAAERSQAQAYRMEMRESVAGGDEIVVETGEWDGQHYYLRQHLGAPLAEVLPEAADVDLTIETAGDRSTLYVRLPKQLAAGMRIISIPPFGHLVDRLEGAWGRVDLDELADLLSGEQDPTSAIGMYDPRLFVDVVTTATDVEDLGDAEIRGVPVRGVAAEVPYADLLAAQGVGPGSSEAIDDITVPIDVWVDRDALVRRVSFEFRVDEITEAFGQEPPGSSRPDVAFTVDLFDYGDESIDVELPADAVDITDAVREALESAPAARGA